jgi:ankyrin repeat protein
VYVCLKLGASPNFADKLNRNPVQLAVERDSATILQALVNHGANVDMASGSFATPLLAAIVSGKSSEVLQLLVAKTQANLEAMHDGQTAAQLLCTRGDTASLTVLLKRGANALVRDGQNRTLLHKAVDQGAVDLVTSLLPFGGADLPGWHAPGVSEPVTPLAYILNTDFVPVTSRIPMARVLLDHGVDPVVLDSRQRTLLLRCLLAGYAEGAMLLIPWSRDVLDLSDQGSGVASLHLAVQMGHHQLVEMLLKAGASVNICTKVGESPLLLALKLGHLAIVRELLKEDASGDSVDNSGCTPLLVALAAVPDTMTGPDQATGNIILELMECTTAEYLNKVDSRGNTAANYVCKWARTDLVEKLFRAGGSVAGGREPALCTALSAKHYTVAALVASQLLPQDLRWRGKDHQTMLWLAAAQGAGSVVQALLDHSGEDLVDRARADGVAPLAIAAQLGAWPTVKILMRAKANPLARDEHGNSPLQNAIRYGEKKFVQLFAASTNTKLNNLNQALEPAVLQICLHRNQQLSTELLRVLLACCREPDVSTPGRSGFTPLHAAVGLGNNTNLELLLLNGANPDAALQDTGTTPLILAVRMKNLPAVTSLLRASANPDLADNYGCTPLWYAACEVRHLSLVQALVQAGCDVNRRHHEFSPLAFLTIAMPRFEEWRQFLQQLLRGGANVDDQLPNKRTILDCVRHLEMQLKPSSRQGDDEGELEIITGEVTDFLTLSRHEKNNTTSALYANNKLTCQHQWRAQLKHEGIRRSFHTKKQDFFISYSWMSEGDVSQSKSQGNGFARTLCHCLRSDPVPRPGGGPFVVWLDLDFLKPGEDLVEGFEEGLRDSAIFVPLISTPLLEMFRGLKQGDRSNVLREWDVALQERVRKLQENDLARNYLQIAPILLHKLEKMPNDTFESRKPDFPKWQDFPDVVAHHNLIRGSSRTVRETVREMTSMLLITDIDPWNMTGGMAAASILIRRLTTEADFSGVTDSNKVFLAADDKKLDLLQGTPSESCVMMPSTTTWLAEYLDEPDSTWSAKALKRVDEHIGQVNNFISQHRQNSKKLKEDRLRAEGREQERKAQELRDKQEQELRMQQQQRIMNEQFGFDYS